jgi:nicotinamidase-related amidase
MKLYIVVDMQNDFVNGALGSLRAEAMIPLIARKLENRPTNSVAIFTQDTHYENYHETLEGQKLPTRHCIYGTEGWEIVPELQKFIDCVVPKSTFGSFKLLDIVEKFDRQDPIEEIRMFGVCTDICVISNALMLRSRFPHIPISIDPQCCAGTSMDNHMSAIRVMQSCHIDVAY